MLKLFISAQNDAHVVILDGNNQGLHPPIPPIKEVRNFKIYILKLPIYNRIKGEYENDRMARF